MEKAKKRILYVIWSLDQGGAEQVVMNLAETLRGDDFEPVICCLNEQGRYAARMQALGIEVYALNKKGKVDIGCVLRLKGLIQDKNIDLVHTHLFTANLWGRFGAMFANVPCVITDHNTDLWKEKYHFLIDWFLLRWTASAVCVSRKVQDFYETNVSGHRKKSVVIHNGIDVSKFKKEKQDSSALKKRLGLNEHAILIGIVGRLVPQKAHKDFIKSIQMLRRSVNEEVHGVIVGDGPEQESLQQIIDQNDLNDYLHFTGFDQNMAEIYAGLDFFVLPSYHEGFPMTILEAMACRLPVIASGVGGVPECVDHAKNGIVVSPRQPDQIVSSLVQLIKDPQFRETIISQAYEDVHRKFCKEVMTDNHKALYLNVIEAAR